MRTAMTTNAIADEDFMVERLTIDWNNKIHFNNRTWNFLCNLLSHQKLYDKINPTRQFSVPQLPLWLPHLWFHLRQMLDWSQAHHKKKIEHSQALVDFWLNPRSICSSERRNRKHHYCVLSRQYIYQCNLQTKKCLPEKLANFDTQK